MYTLMLTHAPQSTILDSKSMRLTRASFKYQPFNSNPGAPGRMDEYPGAPGRMDEYLVNDVCNTGRK